MKKQTIMPRKNKFQNTTYNVHYIPSIFLRDTKKHAELYQLSQERNASYTAYNVSNSAIRIVPDSVDSFVQIVQICNEHNLLYYKYTVPDRKMIKVILRGEELHNFSSKQVFEELLFKKRLPVLDIHQMYLGSSNKKIPLMLIFLSRGKSGRSISSIDNVLGHPVTIELPRNESSLLQCNRCLGFGHAQLYCLAPAWCSICDGRHMTEKCNLNKTNYVFTEEPDHDPSDHTYNISDTEEMDSKNQIDINKDLYNNEELINEKSFNGSDTSQPTTEKAVEALLSLKVATENLKIVAENLSIPEPRCYENDTGLETVSAAFTDNSDTVETPVSSQKIDRTEIFFDSSNNEQSTSNRNVCCTEGLSKSECLPSTFNEKFKDKVSYISKDLLDILKKCSASELNTIKLYLNSSNGESMSNTNPGDSVKEDISEFPHVGLNRFMVSLDVMKKMEAAASVAEFLQVLSDSMKIFESLFPKKN